MLAFNESDLRSWERFYKANFVNSLTGFKSVSLLGTAGIGGQTNLGVFSSIVHLGSDPSLIGFINRPRKAAPHTLANIEATGVYTINHIDPSFLEQAHQTSAKYPEGVSEFEEVGLTPQFLGDFPAPFVQESLVKYSLTLEEILPIRQNGTFLVIGKIHSVLLQEGLMLQDGFIDLHKAGSVCSNGIDGYYQTSPLGRFAYAKPGSFPEKLNR